MDHYDRHFLYNNAMIDIRNGRCVAATDPNNLSRYDSTYGFNEYMLNCFVHPGLNDRIIQITNGMWYNLDDGFRRMASDPLFRFRQGGNSRKVKEWMRKSIMMMLEGWYFTADYCYIDRVNHNTFYFKSELKGMLHPEHVFADMDEGNAVFRQTREQEERRFEQMINGIDTINGTGTENDPIDLISTTSFTVDLTVMSGSLASEYTISDLLNEFATAIEVFQDDEISLLTQEESE